MNTYQIFLISYLVLAFVIAVAMFLLRHTFSPNRTEVIPSIIASLLSGLAWGIALPLAVKVILHRDREEKSERNVREVKRNVREVERKVHKTNI